MNHFAPHRFQGASGLQSDTAPSNRPALNSVFLGGFECSTKRRADGRRLDLVESTGHADFFAADYTRLLEHGISAARDGFRWHLIEAVPGSYDWSSIVPMLRAAKGTGLQVIWDLCHYGLPDWLDIWSDDFVDAFARYSAEAARLIVEETGSAPILCLINEISFWAWGGGEVGRFAPATTGRGGALKQQLVRASIAATDSVRQVAPGARFLHAEPLVHVAPASSVGSDRHAAEHYRVAQFEALDMMAGRVAPELGGRPDCIDLIGVNFYPDNQWYLGGSTIPFGHHAYRPLRDMLAEVYARYSRPLIIAETGAEGTARPSWLHYVSFEVAAACRNGVPVEGICLYPILDYPGWDNDRECEVGLFSVPDHGGRRATHADFAAELQRQQAVLGAVMPSNQSPKLHEPL